MRLVMLGPPGAGKGTQAKRISETLLAPHISTGDMFRDAISRKTEVGKEAKRYMDKGELVPDDTVVRLVEERLKQDDCRGGFIFDGFPRTIVQAEKLDGLLDKMQTPLDLVVNVAVGEDELVKRLSLRKTCVKCGAIYHTVANPSREGSACDSCGGRLAQRDDDREEVIRNRLKVYTEKTAPLIEYYAKKGILRDIDGTLSIETVLSEIKSVLSSVK